MEPSPTSHTEITGFHQQMFKNYHQHFTMGKNEKYLTSRQSKYRRIDVMIQKRRLQWLGHLERMPADRLPKKLLTS